MINMGQIVKTAEPLLRQAGKFIKANPHLLIEEALAEHEQRDKIGLTASILNDILK